METGAGSSLMAAIVMDRPEWVWSCRVADPLLRALDCERRSLAIQAVLATALLLLPILGPVILVYTYQRHLDALDPPPASFAFESLHPDEAVPPGWYEGPARVASDSSECETEDDEERVGLIRAMRTSRAPQAGRKVGADGGGSSSGGRKKRVWGRR